MNTDNTFSKNKVIKIIAYILLIFCVVLVVYPLLFMAFTSLKSTKEFYTNLFWLPKHFEFSNYPTAWKIGKIGIYFKNSAIITIVSAAVSCTVSILGGYALAKLNIPKAELIIDIFMAFNFVPGIAIYISLYTMMGKMNLIRSSLSLIMPYIAWQIPFAIYIMKQYFETIPKELIESGRIDGCTELKIFYYVMIPLVKPAIATIFVFAFINNWGELMWANIVTSANTAVKTLPVGLLNFKTDMGVEWGLYTAGICIVTIPLLVVFRYFQNYFVAGLTNGAVKG